jgi:hypothetical protein
MDRRNHHPTQRKGEQKGAQNQFPYPSILRTDMAIPLPTKEVDLPHCHRVRRIAHQWLDIPILVSHSGRNIIYSQPSPIRMSGNVREGLWILDVAILPTMIVQQPQNLMGQQQEPTALYLRPQTNRGANVCTQGKKLRN